LYLCVIMTTGTHYNSGALIPECNGLSQFTEGTGRPYVPVQEINLIASPLLVQPRNPCLDPSLKPGRTMWLRKSISPLSHQDRTSQPPHHASKFHQNLTVLGYTPKYMLPQCRSTPVCKNTKMESTAAPPNSVLGALMSSQCNNLHVLLLCNDTSLRLDSLQRRPQQIEVNVF